MLGVAEVDKDPLAGAGVQVDNEDLVFTLETIVEKFGEEMAPYAVGLCTHLTRAFWRMQVLPSATSPYLLCLMGCFCQPFLP